MQDARNNGTVTIVISSRPSSICIIIVIAIVITITSHHIIAIKCSAIDVARQ